MEIRKLGQDEKAGTRALYEEVFLEDSEAFVDYYYTEKTKDNVIYGAEEDGRFQAMLHLNPYVLSVNGSERNAHYIVAVATRREYRRRGYMAALIRRALRDMYRAGETFTFLMPAAEEIYLPHDFRTVYEQEKRYYSGQEGYEPLRAGECGALSEAADAYLSASCQVFAKRSEAYYRRLMKECASDGGRLMVKKEGGGISDCRIFFPDPDEGKPKIMTRIIDVRRMLMAVTARSFMAACFFVTDPVIEENNRCVMITGTEFSGIMLMDGKAENSEGEITVAALASLLFGAKSTEEVCREKGVKMTERMKGELAKLVPLSKIYLNETV